MGSLLVTRAGDHQHHHVWVRVVATCKSIGLRMTSLSRWGNGCSIIRATPPSDVTHPHRSWVLLSSPCYSSAAKLFPLHLAALIMTFIALQLLLSFVSWIKFFPLAPLCTCMTLSLTVFVPTFIEGWVVAAAWGTRSNWGTPQAVGHGPHFCLSPSSPPTCSLYIETFCYGNRVLLCCLLFFSRKFSTHRWNLYMYCNIIIETKLQKNPT